MSGNLCITCHLAKPEVDDDDLCLSCFEDEQRGQQGITPDLLHRVEGMTDGFIIDLGNGRFAARPGVPYVMENAEHLAFDRNRVVVEAKTMWDGHDLAGLTEEECYGALAMFLGLSTAGLLGGNE